MCLLQIAFHPSNGTMASYINIRQYKGQNEWNKTIGQSDREGYKRREKPIHSFMTFYLKYFNLLVCSRQCARC